MAWLSYYSAEREDHKEAWGRMVSLQEAEIIIKKLYRHYKLGKPIISWTRGNRRSTCGGRDITINTDWGLNIGCIAHEVAHGIQHKIGFSKKVWCKDPNCIERLHWYMPLPDGRRYHKGNKHAHGKWHDRIQKRIIAYCKKKNYWREETSRRLMPKVLVWPTEYEIKQKAIDHIKIKIGRYEGKIRMYTKKLAKAKRSLSMRTRSLEALQKTDSDIAK